MPFKFPHMISKLVGKVLSWWGNPQCASEGFACNIVLTAYVVPSWAYAEGARGVSIKKGGGWRSRCCVAEGAEGWEPKAAAQHNLGWGRRRKAELIWPLTDPVVSCVGTRYAPFWPVS